MPENTKTKIKKNFAESIKHLTPKSSQVCAAGFPGTHKLRPKCGIKVL